MWRYISSNFANCTNISGSISGVCIILTFLWATSFQKLDIFVFSNQEWTLSLAFQLSRLFRTHDNEAWLPCHKACRPFSRVTEVKFVIHFIIVYEFTIPILNWPVGENTKNTRYNDTSRRRSPSRSCFVWEKKNSVVRFGLFGNNYPIMLAVLFGS